MRSGIIGRVSGSSDSRQRDRFENAKRLVLAARGEAYQPGENKWLGPTKTPQASLELERVAIGVGVPVLTVDEAASRLHTSVRELEQMMSRGEVEFLRLGVGTIVVPASEIERIRPRTQDEGR